MSIEVIFDGEDDKPLVPTTRKTIRFALVDHTPVGRCSHASRRNVPVSIAKGVPEGTGSPRVRGLGAWPHPRKIRLNPPHIATRF